MIRWRSLFRRGLHLLLPEDCAGCGSPLTDDPAPFFCRSCWEGIKPLEEPFCPRCGRPFPSKAALQYSPTHLCGDCRKRPPSYTRARSLYLYEGIIRDAIRLLKYRGKFLLGRALGDLMNSACRGVQTPDVAIPVPLHPTRLREREFNQALLLADRVSRRLNIPLSYDNLIRVRPTTAQTELTRAERRKNLRRSFLLRRPGEVFKKQVLLVDDVFTTGTTVNECAKALRKAGSGDVYVVTLARTV